MSTELGSIVTPWRIDSRDIERAFRDIPRMARGAAEQVNRELGRVGAGSGRGSILPGLAQISEIIQGIPQVGRLVGGLVSPFTDAAEAGIRYNMMLENAMVNYEGLTGSMEKARERLAVLQAYAERKTPFEFPGVLKATQYMNTFGFALDEQLPKLTAWGNAVAGSGDISEEVLQGVVRAFGQIKAKGRVQAEEMEQLAERGIPAWQLLAKAIGKTEAETRKLAETGRLKGREAVDAITAMINITPRYAGQMERMMKTLQGRLSTLSDIRDRAQGIAAQGLTADLSEMLDTALEKGDLATTLATNINSAITPASGLIRVSVKTVLGGGMTAGFTDAMKIAESVLPGSVEGMIKNGVLAPTMKVLGIESPSRVFHEYGVLCALGLQGGMQDGLQGTFETNQRQIQRSLDRLGQEFKDKVRQIAEELRTNPDWLLNVMAFETRGTFSPSVRNPKSGATGLIQFLPSTARGLGTSTDQLAQMSALQQLDFVRTYLRPFAGRLKSQSDLYAAVFGPHNAVGMSDDTVLYRKGTDAYRDNSGLDWDRSDTITKGEAAAMVANRGGFGSVTRANPLPVEIVQMPERQRIDSKFPTPADAQGHPLNLFELFKNYTDFELRGRLERGTSPPKDYVSRPEFTEDWAKAQEFWEAKIGKVALSKITSTKVMNDLQEEYLSYLREELRYREALADYETSRYRFGAGASETARPPIKDIEEIPRAWAEAEESVGKMTLSLKEMLPLIPIDATNRLGDAALDAAQNADKAGAAAGAWADKVIASSDIAKDRLKDLQQDLRSGFDDAFAGGLVDLMQGKGKEAGRTFIVGFAETIQQDIARAISQRLGDVVFGEDGSGGILGRVFDKLFGGILGVKKDPADAALEIANTQALSTNSALQAQNNVALQQNTLALQLSHAAPGAAAGSLGGGLLRSLIGRFFSSFTGGGDIFQAYPGATSLTDLSKVTITPREGGGRFEAGERILVGERRPEVVEFDRPGYVWPSVDAYQNAHAPAPGQPSSQTIVYEQNDNRTVVLNLPPSRTPNYVQPHSSQELADALLGALIRSGR